MRILVVEDDVAARDALVAILQDEGYDVCVAGSIREADAALDAERIDGLLLDLRLPDGSGQQLLEAHSVRRPLPPTIVMTAFGSGTRAIEAMRAGADDYVQKPIDPDSVLKMLRRLIERRTTLPGVRNYAPTGAGSKSAAEPIVGTSASMQQVFKLIGRVAQSDATVLLLGESGSGKELVARALHRYSARASATFVAVNCAAVPEQLLEAELFGFEKGAFTGAVAQRIGRFEAAAGGTIFLDEIGELAPATQAKLLRVLQERTVERLGSNTTLAIDARIVAASNRSLRAEVDAGRFREDLFYRLRVVEIVLPPLRDRREDIEALVDAFLQRAATREGRELHLTAAALSVLERRAWPGNVRELENALERAIVLSNGRIDVEHVTEDGMTIAE